MLAQRGPLVVLNARYSAAQGRTHWSSTCRHCIRATRAVNSMCRAVSPWRQRQLSGRRRTTFTVRAAARTKRR